MPMFILKPFHLQMMERNKILLALALMILGPFFLQASHYRGSEITYSALGNNVYRIFVTEYFECGGLINTPGVPSGGLSFIPILACGPVAPTALGAWTVASDIEVTPIVGLFQATPSCGASPYERVRQFVFSRDYDFSGITCPLRLSSEGCCRSGTVTSLVIPSSAGYETHVNMWGPALENNSPKWLDPSYIILDQGQSHRISMAANDIDGDSLVYSIDSLFTNSTGGGVVYNPGYSHQFPLGLSTPVSIDPNTGDLLIPNTMSLPQGRFAIGISVREYRNGTEIGKYYRDITMLAIPGISGGPGGTHSEPYIAPYGGNYPTPTGATYIDSFTVRVAQGTYFEIPIEVLYPAVLNPGSQLSIGWSQNLVNAAFGNYITGMYQHVVTDSTPVARLVWTAQNPGQYAFNVWLEDTAQEVMSIADYSYLIVVDSCNMVVDAGPDSSFVCPGGSVTWTAQITNGVPPYTYMWSTGATTPSITVNTPGYYEVTAQDGIGCLSVDTLYLGSTLGPIADAGPDLNLCSNDPLPMLGTPAVPNDIYSWTPAASLNNPNAAQPTLLQTNAGTYTYELEVTNLFGCTAKDSVTITIHSDSLAPPYLSPAANTVDLVCIHDTFSVSYTGPLGPNVQLTWAGQYNLQVISGSGAGPYEITFDSTGGAGLYLEVTDGVCTYEDTLVFNVVLNCVWPGDADNDGVANNNDLLALGLMHGNMGVPRPNASLNWTGQAAYAWPTSLPSGVNANYSDTDGSGTVNDDDTLAIHLNYGLTHTKGQASFGGMGDPILYLDYPTDSVAAGDTVVMDLVFGTDTLPADSIYGIALTVQYDLTLVDSGSAHFGYSGWLGNYGTDLLGIQHDNQPNGEVDLGLTRINQMPMSGYGVVASFSIVMIDDIAGKTSLAEILELDIVKVRIIRLDGSEVPVNAQPTLLTVTASGSTGIRPDLGTALRVYPIPAQNQLFVELGSAQNWTVSLLTLDGKEVNAAEARMTDRLTLPLEGLSNGLYFLRVRNERGTEVRKVQVLR